MPGIQHKPQTIINSTINNPTYSPIASMTNTVVAAGVASTQLVAPNASRKYLALTNDDAANTVYLGFGAPAVVGQGVRINANGGAYEMTVGNLFLGAVYGIASVAANVLVTEGV